MSNEPDPRREHADDTNGSLAGLIRRLLDDVRGLFRQEIALAKAEVREAIATVVKRVSQMAMGGGVIVVGSLVFVSFVIIGLGLLLGDRYWLSSLIVTLVLLGGGAALALQGARKIGDATLAPEETIASLQTTKEWATAEAEDLRASLTGLATPGSTALPPSDGVRALPSQDPSRALPSESGEGGTGAGASVIRVDKRAAPGIADREAPLPATREHQAPARREAAQRPDRSSDDPLIKRVAREFGEDDVPGQAAGLAYYMFTSLPPAILVLFALSGFFGGQELSDYLTTQLQNVMPGSADDPDSAVGFLSRFIEDVATERAPGPLSIGLITGLWAASAVFGAMSNALNRAYDVRESRSWIHRKAIALGVMVAFLALFFAGSIILIAGPQIADAIDLYGIGDILWTILQWPLAFALVVGAFFLAYYLLPDRDQSTSKKRILVGATAGAGLWLVATVGFRIYIANFGSYSETYGFIGAILVLLLWMYLTGIVILLGGEIGSELERGVQ